MTKRLRIGYVPLTDAALLHVVKAQNLTASYGLDLELVGRKLTHLRHCGPQRAGPDEARFGAAEAGATAIEYALIAALVSVFVVGAISFTGNGVKATYNVISNAMVGAVSN